MRAIGRVGLLLAASGALVAAAALPVRAQARFDIQVKRAELSFDELRRLVPALEAVTLPPGFEVSKLRASGPLTALELEFLLRSDRSRIAGTVTGDLTGPERAFDGKVSLTSVNLARLLGREALPTEITADASFDLALDTSGASPNLTGDFSVEAARLSVAGYSARQVTARGEFTGQGLRLDALRARAYGGSVTAEGTVGLPLGRQPTTFQLRGRAAGVDLRRLPDRLPVPDVASDLDFTFRVADTGPGVTGRVEFAPSTLAGGTIAEGTTATFDLSGEEIQYSATGRVANVDPQRIGEAFEIEALTEPAYAGSIDATFAVEGTGGSLQPLKVQITDSRLLGGRVPRMELLVRRTGELWRVAAQGAFASIEPGLLVEAIEGQLTGTADVEMALALGEDGFQLSDLEMEGSVRVTDGRLQGVPLEGLVAAGSFDEGVLRVRKLELAASDMAVRASGTLAVDGSAPSDLQYYIDTPRLERFRELVGVPIEGDVKLEGRITGTEVLQITGTLAGTAVGYEDTQATTLHAEYAVALPRAEPAAATGRAEIEATFLRVAGRTFTETVVDATYDDRRIAYDARVQEAERSFESAGRLLLLPDRQLVELTSFVFQAPGATWRMPPAREAVIEYGGEGVRVGYLRLESATGETIVVRGRLGATEESPEALEAWVNGLALEHVDGLLFGEQGITGRLDAYAAVRGTLDQPIVEARLQVEQGSVRNFEYDVLNAVLETSAEAYVFTARLLQDPASWIFAEGRLPRTVPGPAEAGEKVQPIDLRVRSSPLGLGFVGALTDTVRQVEGTLEADVRVTGTLQDPVFDGFAAITGGRFQVPALGTSFRGLETRLAFEPDVVVVPEFRLLDENGEWLRVEGRLPYSAGQLGEVTIAVESDDFEIMDRDLADIHVDSDLVITGTLVEPRLEGRVRVTEGELRVDRILDLRDTAYRPAPIEGVVDAAPVTTVEAGIEEEPDEGILAEAPFALRIALEIPALLLTGRDIRGPASVPVGLGDVNITVAGDLRLRKDFDQPLVILGDITTVRGTYQFQGRRFDIERGGQIRFPGVAELNPLLDLTAVRRISGVETAVRISGTLQAPELALSSVPPLDEADILSLIIFNQPASQLGAGQQVSLGRRAASIAAGFVGSKLAESIGSALNLDVLEIETGENVEGLTPVLTVGEQLGENLFLKLRRQFGGEGATQFLIEYEIADWLRVQSNISDERGASRRALFNRIERGGLNWIFFFSY